MVHRHLKLKMTKRQEATITEWLPILTSVWNWGIRKIQLDAAGGIYHPKRTFQNLLANTSKTLGVPGHTIGFVLLTAHQSWQRCFNGIAKKPRLKGQRNRLNSIPFPDVINQPQNYKIRLPILGMVRYHKQEIPEGKIKCGRIIRRASGWYLCLFIDAEPEPVPIKAHGAVGIDPGYETLLTLSNGEKVSHPKELQQSLKRLAQAQRGKNKKLTARLQERILNQRKDRNHKLSRRLVSENAVIAFSKDNLRGLSRSGFGKSVASASHGQLRFMLAYKCRAGGRRYIEVPSKGSTSTCSSCGASSGPCGKAGLSVRQWVCSACGTLHDRDINAAINTLIAAVGATVERGQFSPQTEILNHGEVHLAATATSSGRPSSHQLKKGIHC